MNRWIRSLLFTLGGLAIGAPTLTAQSTISGRITSDAGGPLAFVAISVPLLGIGAYSKDDGTYSITVPSSRITGASTTFTVNARRVGFAPKTVSVVVPARGSVTQDFVLVALPSQLTGIVVTALGVEKEKSQLGTAQQQLTTAELHSSQDPTIINQLAGKVSGVIISGAGTQEGSANIRIRGSNSITGNN